LRHTPNGLMEHTILYGEGIAWGQKSTESCSYCGGCAGVGDLLFHLQFPAMFAPEIWSGRFAVWLPCGGDSDISLSAKIRWPVGLMDKASASGAGDSRFESWAGHFGTHYWRQFRARMPFRTPMTGVNLIHESLLGYPLLSSISYTKAF
jgi:hypothetical protein